MSEIISYQIMWKLSSIVFLSLLLLLGNGCNNNTQPEPADSSRVIMIGEGEQEVPVVGISVGNRAPNVSLKDFEGNQVTFSDFYGKPIFIDFWAAWCPFCLREIPDIQKIHEQNPDLVILGIHRSETESLETGKEFAKKLGVTYTLLKDTKGNAYNTFSGGRPLMPIGIFLDKEGVIQERLYGPKSLEQMEKAIAKLK